MENHIEIGFEKMSIDDDFEEIGKENTVLDTPRSAYTTPNVASKAFGAGEYPNSRILKEISHNQQFKNLLLFPDEHSYLYKEEYHMAPLKAHKKKLKRLTTTSFKNTKEPKQKFKRRLFAYNSIADQMHKNDLDAFPLNCTEVAPVTSLKPESDLALQLEETQEKLLMESMFEGLNLGNTSSNN